MGRYDEKSMKKGEEIWDNVVLQQVGNKEAQGKRMFLFRHTDEAREKGIRLADPGGPEARGAKRISASWPRLDALTVDPMW